LELSNIEAGLQTIGFLRNNTSAETVAQRAATENIDVVPLSRYCCSTSIAEGLQIGFAAVHEREIRTAVLKLARIFEVLNSESAKKRGIRGVKRKIDETYT
jgi:GntR family transcriptional regulator/MocR family aminotransferase